MRGIRVRIVSLIATLAALSIQHAASACSVCFGDPDSKMIQGAKSGVIVLALIIYGLLMCMGATAAMWFVRVRRMNARAPRPADHQPDGPKEN